MLKKLTLALAAAGLIAAANAQGAVVTELVDQPVASVRGVPAGVIEDFIVDVNVGRVVYVIIRGPERFYTLPVRALEAPGRVDMSHVNDLHIEVSEREDPRFRRARRLIGLPVTNPGNGLEARITDIAFDVETGMVESVLVATPEGPRSLPPPVLALRHFPALTRWQVENPPVEVDEDLGYVRREPAERRRLHDHEWERFK